MGPFLPALLARSWQAATTAANSTCDGGFPLASCQPRTSVEALAGATASLAAHAAKPNRIKTANLRIRPPGTPRRHDIIGRSSAWLPLGAIRRSSGGVVLPVFARDQIVG